MKFGGDRLKQKQNENKQRIFELLESSNSVEQHIYYQKGENPEKIQQYYLGSTGVGITGGQKTLAQNIQPKIDPIRSKYAYKPNNKPNVLRTIYMPNYEVDCAKEEIE